MGFYPGSGKTSLLDVIGQKHKGIVTAGKLQLNGQPLTTDIFRKKGGYVYQHDKLTDMPHLTTLETLHYTAQLKFKHKLKNNREISEKVMHNHEGLHNILINVISIHTRIPLKKKKKTLN